jgi:hypothetical protein
MINFEDQKDSRTEIKTTYINNMLIQTCFVVAPDIRRSVVTIPGCNTQRKE